MKSYDFARIQARPFPTAAELGNPYIYGRVKYVLNVSDKDYPKEIAEGMARLGIRSFFLPLVETGNDMGLENILRTVRILELADEEGVPVIVHCGFGNNRSRVVVECFHYRKFGFQLEDAYKGARNHLEYNCSNGLLPPIEEVESMILALPKSASLAEIS